MSGPSPDDAGAAADDSTRRPRYVDVAAVLFVTAAIIQGLLVLLFVVAVLATPPHSEGWDILLMGILNLYMAPVTLLCGGAVVATRWLARRR